MTAQLTAVGRLGVDFSWPDGLVALQAEVAGVARAAAVGRDVVDDSWVTGYSREFSLELGRRGWLGMTWPIE